MKSNKTISHLLNSLGIRRRSANHRLSSGKASSADGTNSPIESSIPAPSSLPDSLQVSRENGILRLILHRPAVLNAMDLEMAEALRRLLQLAAADATVRTVILTGRGRAFCAGGDLKFALKANPQQPGDSFLALTAVLHECIELIRTMAKPVMAVINGPAAGAGLFLALACDVRLMAETAYLKQSNTSFGLSLPAGGTFFLPRLLGMGRALEMVLLDQPVDAATAHALGLVTEVVKDHALDARANALAEQLVQKPLHTLGLVKRLMNQSFTRSLPEQLLAEQQAIAQSANHVEGREGLSAFVEKRQPVFTGLR